MITPADEKRNEAVESIQNAIRNLSEIVINKCSGSQNYYPDYRSMLSSQLATLVRIHDEIVNFRYEE